MDCPAVVFVIFNRPDLTAEVFEAIRAARPPQLLIVADGPRDSRPQEAGLCEATRQAVADVDWPCEVLRKYADHNLGCGPNVSQGIDWAFSQVEEALVLEDDGLPHPTLFPFCAEMLERYQDDSRVMHISATNYGVPAQAYLGYSYGFSAFGLIAGGWATWRRAWKEYDFRMATWPEFRDSGMMAGLPGGRRWLRVLEREWNLAHAGKQTWDHQWQYAVMTRHGLAISPAVNLLSNLGFRDDATQTPQTGDLANMPTEAMVFPLRHPPMIAENPWIERHFSRLVIEHMGTTVQFIRRLVPSHRVRRTLKRALKPAYDRAVALRSPKDAS